MWWIAIGLYAALWIAFLIYARWDRRREKLYDPADDELHSGIWALCLGMLILLGVAGLIYAVWIGVFGEWGKVLAVVLALGAWLWLNVFWDPGKSKP